MDPVANLREQREIARRLVEHDDLADIADDATRLADLVLALNEWGAKGGYIPNWACEGRMSTYMVSRFYEDERPPEVVETGLTLEEAQTHCKREDTHGYDANGVAWFDGYNKED